MTNTYLLPDGTEITWASEHESKLEVEKRINDMWESWYRMTVKVEILDSPFPCPRPHNIPDCVWPHCRCI